MIVATSNTADLSTMQVGTLVAGEVIEYLRNNLPPVLDWSNLFQAGEAVLDRLLPDGSLRTAYSTFRRVDVNTWEYRGTCIRGEMSERGTIPSYCNH